MQEKSDIAEGTIDNLAKFNVVKCHISLGFNPA